VPDYLLASKKLNNEHISKQKGYISRKQLYDKLKSNTVLSKGVYNNSNKHF